MVSVIIPVYNAEKTLPDCVASILRQSFRDFELILVDDGSIDHSARICDELDADCRSQGLPCQVIHKRNGGVSSARNCGMAHARGEYFVCVDSDDVVEPCYLEDLVRTAETHPEFGHVLCGFRSVSLKRGYILTEREPLSVVNRRDYMLLYEKVLIQSPCLGLYKTELVRKHHLMMREELSLGEDILFNLSYLDALGEAPIGVINKANYLYLDENPNSMNRRYREDLQQIFETVDHSIAAHLTQWKITDEVSWQRYYQNVYYHYLRVLENTYQPENTASRQMKLSRNSAVIRQEAFREALRKSGVAISPRLRRAFETGNYKSVRRAERIQKLKASVRSLLK